MSDATRRARQPHHSAQSRRRGVPSRRRHSRPASRRASRAARQSRLRRRSRADRVDWDSGAPAAPRTGRMGPVAVGAAGAHAAPMPGLRQQARPGEDWIANAAPRRRQRHGARARAHRRARSAQCRSAAARRGAAAAPSRPAARRAAQGPLREPDGPGRPGDHEIRNRHPRGRRSRGAGDDGEVHRLRHADDIVQNIPAEDRHVLEPQYSMLASFFGERIGGVRFFDIVERAKTGPDRSTTPCSNWSMPVWRSASRAGTDPKAAASPRCSRSSATSTRRCAGSGRGTARDLSPALAGSGAWPQRPRLSVPIWAVSGGRGCPPLRPVRRAPLPAERGCRGGGLRRARARSARRRSRIARKASAPPPPPPAPTPTQASQLQRIRAALAPEIAAGAMSVPEPTGPTGSSINVGNLAAVQVGLCRRTRRSSAACRHARGHARKRDGTGQGGRPHRQPAARRRPTVQVELRSVGRARDQCRGASEGRASADPARFKVEGKGPDQPIADNKTEAGRRHEPPGRDPDPTEGLRRQRFQPAKRSRAGRDIRI